MSKKDKRIKPAVCPVCGKTYNARPAVSRTDSSKLICPDCGTREALASIGVGAEEQEKIIETIHRNRA